MIDKSLDVICVTEHWMTEAEIGTLSMDGYNTLGFSARKEYIGGGTLIFVRDNLNANVKHFKVDCNVEKCIEYSCVFVSDFNLCVLAVYRSPSGHFDTFLSSLDHLLNNLGTSKSLVLAGDFNVHFGTNKPDALKLCGTLAGFGMQQTIRVPTRQNVCLDNVFVSAGMNFSNPEVINLDISDHLGQIVTISNDFNKNISSQTKNKFRPITQRGLFSFYNVLSNKSWNFVDDKNIDANIKCELFMGVLNGAYVECFPEKWCNVRSEGGIAWFGEELRAMREHLRLLGEISSQYNSVVNHDCYKKYKNEYKRALRNAKIAANDSRINSSTNPIKCMWQIINKHRGNTKTKNVESNNLDSDDFNNYFLSIANEIVQGMPESDTDPLENLNNIDVPITFAFSEMTFNQIRDIINKLKNKNSKDIYGHNVKIIKSVLDLILVPLTKIINFCIKENTFPKCLKRALVVPLFKKGNMDMTENYRPISLLPIISKIFEKAIAKQIVQFFEGQNLFAQEQFGFRRDRSTTLGILNLVSDIMDAFDDQAYDVVLFCDLSKAFDCVDHGILLRKLKAYNFREDSVQMLKSYLTERYQAVQCGGVLSAEGEIKIGVPQGSILGPILFLIYVNDLPLVDQKANYTLFADDTTISVRSKTLEGSLQGSLGAERMAEKWFISNRLLLNQSKTERMVFTLRDTGPIRDPVCQVKFLGVDIDPKAQWNTHVETVASRLNKSLYLLRRLADNLSHNALKTAYFATFHAQLSYAVLVWGHAPNTQHLFGLQRKAVRVICGLGYRDDCRACFRELGVLTLPSLYILENLLYVVKNIHLFSTHEDVHTYQTRNKCNLVPAYWRIRRCQNGPGYWAVKYFNVLPSKIKTLPVEKFKQIVKQILILNVFYSHEEYFNYFCP